MFFRIEVIIFYCFCNVLGWKFEIRQDTREEIQKKPQDIASTKPKQLAGGKSAAFTMFMAKDAFLFL